MRKQKAQISCAVTAVTAQLMSAFVFAKKIVQSLFFLSLYQSYVVAQPGLCRSLSETQETGFPATQLKFCYYIPWVRIWKVFSGQCPWCCIFCCQAADAARTVATHCEVKTYEPRCEKTGFRGFRPGLTQTGLYNQRRWLES